MPAGGAPTWSERVASGGPCQEGTDPITGRPHNLGTCQHRTQVRASGCDCVCVCGAGGRQGGEQLWNTFQFMNLKLHVAWQHHTQEGQLSG